MGNSVLSVFRESLIEKNVTFLLGAGASAPYFSSLGNFEEILSNANINERGKGLVKTLFYYQSIKDNTYIYRFMNDKCYCHNKKEIMLSIIDEYSRFLHNGIEFLKVRNSRISPKRINLVTTNYDLFIESSIDRLLEENPRIFFNDGTNGYGKRVISSDNFNKTLLYSGVFDNYSNEMPAINLIKCHGSVNWQEYSKKDKPSKIQVAIEERLISEINNDLEQVISEVSQHLKESSWMYGFDSLEGLIDKISTSNLVEDSQSSGIFDDLNLIAENVEDRLVKLIKKIETLQIVLPTKNKFQTTLIQEHYFNMLRHLSYELEKKQSVLVVFGFSFQDEHITEIIQRSLNNPTLLVIIFCFTDQDKEKIIQKFNFSKNNIPINLKFIEPKTFFEEELTEKDMKANCHDSRYTIIKKEGKMFKYSSVVSILENKEEDTSIPVLDFSSINKILEMDIVNKYKSFKKGGTGKISEYEYGDTE